MINDNNSRKKVLLVDDDEIHLEITELALKDEYEIFIANSGREALEFLNEGKNIPDLILLDLIMPMMDGWTVFEKIQDIAAFKFTPIIFYTSLDEESAVEKAYELGVFDYVTKPCDQSVLLMKINDALQKAELKKQHYGI
ncbi:MAG: response regulator [Treponema sp.]|jgi:putative two-component system response regulator|nr:response regulator [Treponema sp.]